ncbi:MAG: hypothetical protein ABIP30_11000 [Ferruginibacter sp.]
MEILLILIFLPFILVIVGIVQSMSKEPLKKKSGKKVLLIAICILGVEILIGWSVCSNMNFGGMH